MIFYFQNRYKSYEQERRTPSVKPSISYLICTTPRCGGYLLFEALENIGLAGIPGEYFWDDKEWTKKWRATNYTDFLNKVKEKSDGNLLTV